MPSAKMPLEFQELVTVQLSDDERLSQKISPESMGMAISALHRDGVVVLANAVDVEHVDKLNSILSAEAEIMASRSSKAYPPVPDSLLTTPVPQNSRRHILAKTRSTGSQLEIWLKDHLLRPN